MPLVAVLLPGPEDLSVQMTAALRDGLKQAGRVEGTHCSLALRFANGDMPQLPKLAKELMRWAPKRTFADHSESLVSHLR